MPEIPIIGPNYRNRNLELWGRSKTTYLHGQGEPEVGWWSVKVSKYRKQILKFSFEPKNERFFSVFLP